MRRPIGGRNTNVLVCPFSSRYYDDVKAPITMGCFKYSFLKISERASYCVTCIHDASGELWQLLTNHIRPYVSWCTQAPSFRTKDFNLLAEAGDNFRPETLTALVGLNIVI